MSGFAQCHMSTIHVWHIEPSSGCTGKKHVKNKFKLNLWIMGAQGVLVMVGGREIGVG